MGIAVGVEGAWAARVTTAGVTSPAFSPAAKSLIVVDFHLDCASLVTVNTINITDSVGLTWTEIGTEQRAGSGGLVKSWWAYTSSAQTNMTVTGTVAAGGDDLNKNKTIKVTTYTGTASVKAVVSKTQGSSVTNNLTVNVNTSQHESMIQGSALDWAALGAPTSTDTATSYHTAALISGTTVHKAATTNLWGTSVSLNFDAFGTGTPDWAYKVYEIIPALHVKEVLTGSAANVALTLTTASDTAVDDVLLAIYANDYYQAAQIAAPTGTAGTWTNVGATGDLGNTDSHITGFWRKVTSAGAQTVTTDRVFDEEFHTVLLVIRGADTTSPVDAVAATTGASSTSWTAPAVSPTGADDLLVCGGIGGTAVTIGSFTPPTGMFEHYDGDDPGGFSSATVASQRLTASGSTGTRTFTASEARTYAVLSVAVKAAGGTPTVSGSAALAGRSDASATGVKSAVTTAVLSGQSGIVAQGIRTSSSSVTMSGMSLASVQGAREILGSSTLAALSSMTAQGVRGVVASALLAALSDMAVTASTSAGGGNPVSLLGRSDLTVSATVTKLTQAVLSGQSGMAALGVRSTVGVVAPLDAKSAMAILTQSEIVGAASLAGIASMSVLDALVTKHAQAVLSGQFHVNALGVRVMFVSVAAASGVSSLTVIVQPAQIPVAHLLGLVTNYGTGLQAPSPVKLINEYGVSLTWNQS